MRAAPSGDRARAKHFAVACHPASPSTGAHIQPSTDGHVVATQTVTVATLDSILAGIGYDDRTLLKLDLQGWELEALHGAVAALAAIEVILIEVSFYAQAYEPPVATLIAFLSDHGFVLHDIASLIGRARDDRAHQADFVFVRAGNSKHWIHIRSQSPSEDFHADSLAFNHCDAEKL